MTIARFVHIALMVAVMAIFVSAAGVSAADQKIRVKVPGIT